MLSAISDFFTIHDYKNVPLVGWFLQWLQDNNMDFGVHVTIVCAVLLYLIATASDTLLGSSASIFFTLAPIWFPWVALDVFHFRWMDYVGKKFYLSRGRTQYRINLPQEVLKSPEAMEFVLNQIWSKQTPDNFWETYIDGKRPLPIGLEIVSIGGDVRFYVNLHTKKGVETFVPAIYSQYPGVEIVEEPVDYAAEIPIGDPNWDTWSTHIGKKKNKLWAPIRTYVDYKLDTMPDEDEKVDPLTILLDQLGNILPHERVYVQYVITGYRESSLINGQLQFKEGKKWTENAEEHVSSIMQRDPITKAPVSPEGSDFDGMPRISPGERDTVTTIERNIEKSAYNVGIRYMYMAKRGQFRPDMLNALNRMFAQFDVEGRQGLGVRWRTDFDYMWFSDPFDKRLPKIRKVEHRFYKLRKYPNQNQSDHPRVFTTEELATMFHLPGKVAMTPNLSRIPSTRSEAPSNLPVGNLPI